MSKALCVLILFFCALNSAVIANTSFLDSYVHPHDTEQFHDKPFHDKPYQAKPYKLPIDFALMDVNLVNAYNDNSIHLNPNANVHVKVLSLVNQELGLENPLIQSPFLRIMRRLESSQPTCSPAKIKTSERDAKFLFSVPTGLTLSIRLFSKVDIAASHPQIFNEKGQLTSLQALAKVNDKFKILYRAKQSYGETLDHQLLDLPPWNKINFPSSESFEKPVTLFLSNRSDFLLTAPVILSRSFPQQSTSLFSYEIEGQPPYFTGHLMCNDFPETREYLAEFDEKVLELYDSGKFKELLVRSHENQFSHEIGKFVDECLETGACAR